MLLDIIFMPFHLYVVSPHRLKIPPKPYTYSFHIPNHLTQILLGFKYLSLAKTAKYLAD